MPPRAASGIVADAMPSERDCLHIVANGLPHVAGKRKRVVIVGAGMAGLVAASELLRAGHDPIVLEAQQRVGGRVSRCASRSRTGCRPRPARCASRARTSSRMALVEQFGLATAAVHDGQPEGVLLLSRRKRRVTRSWTANPHALGVRGCAEHERGATAAQLWERGASSRSSPAGRDRATTRWAEIVAQVRPVLHARVPRGERLVGRRRSRCSACWSTRRR